MSKDLSVALHKGCWESALYPGALCRLSSEQLRRHHLAPDCALWARVASGKQGSDFPASGHIAKAEHSCRTAREEKEEERRKVSLVQRGELW